MPFGQGRSGGGGRGRDKDKKPGDKEKGQRRTLFRRRKVCKFCADKIDDINYKDVKLLGSRAPAPCTSGSCRRPSSARVKSR
jgi:hypothetical protein